MAELTLHPPILGELGKKERSTDKKDQANTNGGDDLFTCVALKGAQPRMFAHRHGYRYICAENYFFHAIAPFNINNVYWWAR